MIKPILLVAAGFSRNWGGWLAGEAFEYLLGHPKVISNERLRSLLWKHQPLGGFEDALAQVQRERGRSTNLHDLAAFQTAILDMFDLMNKGFADYPSIEFSTDRARMLRTFLIRFDAIFTLNQDTLLEQHYLNDNISLLSEGRWNGWSIPGMKPRPGTWEPLQSHTTGIWIPSGSLERQKRAQPIYKLHGSSNWRDASSGSLLVMGGNKVESIHSNAMLAKYSEEFRARLLEPGARLMIIGYGFRDSHINDVIVEAVSKGLRFFVVDPNGSDVAAKLNPTRNFGAIYSKTSLEDAFQSGLIGSSRRALSETFGPTGSVEHAKVTQFFRV